MFILPCDSIAPQIEGVYSFEKVKNIVTSASSSIHSPLLIIGLDPDRSMDVNALLLEPNYTDKQWKSQSEDDWDNFVLKHASALF